MNKRVGRGEYAGYRNGGVREVVEYEVVSSGSGYKWARDEVRVIDVKRQVWYGKVVVVKYRVSGVVDIARESERLREWVEGEIGGRVMGGYVRYKIER